MMGLLYKRLDRLLVFTPGSLRDSGSASTAQEVLIEVGRRLSGPSWVSYLVGGTLRDLLVGPETNVSFEPRDIDIIVDGATREQLQEVLRGALIFERFTRFGGLHLSRSLVSSTRVLFDIWTLADTWGFHSQNIAARIEDFPKTTFLNVDSCAVELSPPSGGQRQLFEKGFFKSIARRILDINYAPNPFPYVCIARSLVLAAQLAFSIARPLAEFILDYTSKGGIELLIEAQQTHYGTVRCDARELGPWLLGIGQQFSSGQHVIHLDVPRARRYQLRRDHPETLNRG